MDRRNTSLQVPAMGNEGCGQLHGLWMYSDFHKKSARRSCSCQLFDAHARALASAPVQWVSKIDCRRMGRGRSIKVRRVDAGGGGWDVHAGEEEDDDDVGGVAVAAVRALEGALEDDAMIDEE